MSKVNENQMDVLYTESPASWNTRYLTPEGFICQLTLRDDNGVRLLEKSRSAMQELILLGCLPYPTHDTNGKEVKDPKAWCTIHNCEMKRWEKGGKVWYSHQVDDSWCYGAKS